MLNMKARLLFAMLSMFARYLDKKKKKKGRKLILSYTAEVSENFCCITQHTVKEDIFHASDTDLRSVFTTVSLMLVPLGRFPVGKQSYSWESCFCFVLNKKKNNMG